MNKLINIFIYIYIYIYRRRPAGEYSRPPSLRELSRRTLSRKIEENTYTEAVKYKVESIKRCFEKLTKTFLKWSRKLKKSRSGACLGALGGDLETENLSKAVLADLGNFGQARIDQNLVPMGQDGAKLEPRWRQDLPSWGQDGHLEAVRGSILSISGGLGSDL